MNSCEKHDTYGTLEIEVVADAQRTFRIEIYPYCIDASVQNLPVYSKEFNTRHVREQVILSPGNYIVEVYGSTQAVNVIGGKETKIEFYRCD